MLSTAMALTSFCEPPVEARLHVVAVERVDDDAGDAAAPAAPKPPRGEQAEGERVKPHRLPWLRR